MARALAHTRRSARTASWALGSITRGDRAAGKSITNAITYSKPGVTPRIHIVAERRGEQWEFAVSDNGIGIDMQFANLIFEPFKRLHGGELPGTGIGLAICKRIVERHGGRIHVESAPDAGATFRLTVPAALGQAVPAKA